MFGQWWKQCRQGWGVWCEVWTRINTDDMPLIAASVAFWMLLTIVPLLLLGVSVASFVLDPIVVQQRLEEFSREVLTPAINRALRDQVLSVVENRGLLTGVSLLVGLWSGMQVFIILEQAMNRLWHARHRRSFLRSRLLALGMLVLSGTALLVAFVLVAAFRLLRQLGMVEFNVLAGWLIGTLVPGLLAVVVFALLYHFLPMKRVTWRSVLPGALFAGVVWTLFLHLFNLYLVNFADYPLLYGSLGGLVLVMFWFYYSALIMLTGAEIAVVTHNRLMNAGVAEERQAEET